VVTRVVGELTGGYSEDVDDPRCRLCRLNGSAAVGDEESASPGLCGVRGVGAWSHSTTKLLNFSTFTQLGALFMERRSPDASMTAGEKC